MKPHVLPSSHLPPLDLPFCSYPGIRDASRHGLHRLPADLPLVDLAGAGQHRSHRYRVVPLSDLRPSKILEVARVVAASFVKREPQTRHINPKRDPAPGVMDAIVRDPFGAEEFAAWTKESLFYWFIRLMVLTDPASPRTAIRPNHEALRQSLALLDAAGRVVGGAFNETLPSMDGQLIMRSGDPVLAESYAFVEPILTRLLEQDAEAVAALCAAHPTFRAAYAAGRVGHHFMVARSAEASKYNAFDLVAGSAERYIELGFEYMVVEATNQWTGAACEALGGVRVHFRPYHDKRSLRRSSAPLPGAITSPDGYIAAKDSGCMFYVIRLR